MRPQTIRDLDAKQRQEKNLEEAEIATLRARLRTAISAAATDAERRRLHEQKSAAEAEIAIRRANRKVRHAQALEKAQQDWMAAEKMAREELESFIRGAK